MISSWRSAAARTSQLESNRSTSGLDDLLQAGRGEHDVGYEVAVAAAHSVMASSRMHAVLVFESAR